MPSLNECLIGTWQYDFIEDRLHLNRDWYEIAHQSAYNPIKNLARFREIVHIDDLHLVSNERMAELLETKGHKSYIRLVGADGFTRTLLCSADLLKEFDDKAPRLAGTMVDATSYLRGGSQVFPTLPHVTLGALLDTIQHLRCAALAINDDLEVIAMNARAQTFLLEGPITVMQGHLFATSQESNRRLQAFLQEVRSAFRTRDRQDTLPIGFLRQGNRPIVIQAQFVGVALKDTSPHPRAIISIVDLEASGTPRAEHVRSAFGLTVAESRLALILMDHFRLREAAETLGISHETARTQLRTVFQKTGARNQAELLVMLERLGRGSFELMNYIKLLENDAQI